MSDSNNTPDITEIDSDLENDCENCSIVSNKTDVKQPHIHRHRVTDDTDPDALIGGTNVIPCAQKRPALKKKRTSIFAEDDDELSTESVISTTYSYLDTAVAAAKDQDKSNDLKPEDTSHKIFTFTLPLGGNSLLPSRSLSSFVSSLLPGDSPSTQDERLQHLNKEQIKEKLKRSDSITSLEEMALFNNEKGIDNVRARAFKKTFEMESLKQTFKNITAAPGEYTYDGYEYIRLESIWDELDGDFLVMGGYRGSVLRNALTHRRIWIPIKAGLNIRKIDLLIGPNDKDEFKTEKKIIPDGMLTHIGPVDISKRLIRKLKANPKVKVENFGYDWRLSLDISAEHLRKKLESIYSKQKQKKGTYVIAHSMGGLVAHKVLQEHTHLIRGLIYAGAPGQCPNILGPLKFGDEVLMNKTILSKEANFFMRSSFYFLPTDGRCFVDKHTYKRYDLDFFDPNVWIKLGLSPVVDEERLIQCQPQKKPVNDKTPKEKEKDMAKTESKEKPPQPGIPTDVKDFLGVLNPVPMLKSLSGHSQSNSNSNSGSVTSDLSDAFKIFSPTSFLTKISESATDALGMTECKECQEEEREMLFQTPYDQCIDYLERTLTRTKKYLDSLTYIPDKEYPPLAIIYGNQIPTVRGVKIDGLKDVKLGNYDDFYYGPGDGVVHHKWLLPEQRGFPVDAKIASNCGHVSLLSDLESVAKAFISIIDNEKKTA